MFLPQNPSPLIVTLEPEPARTTTLQDVVIGAFGVTGALVLVAALAGVLVAVALVLWRRFRPPGRDHLPSVSPSTPISPPPSPPR